VSEPVLLERDGAVAIVTLNRPDRLNAWTGRMETAYRAVMSSAAEDPDVRVIVVTGAGRGFCAGADAAALGPMTATGEYRSGVTEPVEPGFAWQLRLPKPVIAVLNGAAAGVGLVLALFCDLRYAAPGVKLTTSFARLGLPAEYGTSWLLPRLVGRSRAADLLFTSRVVLAEEALTMGLVDRAHAVDDALAAAHRMATASSPSSLATMKQQLWDDLTGRTLDASIESSVDLLHRMVGEADFVEGVRALQEKRDPSF
jgi:enoyl-CoA hydratase/carnithine racemase